MDIHGLFKRNISSFDPAECSPLADWTKLCMRDVEAIAGILFFMWYVIWGVPITIRFFRWCRIQVNSIRSENLAKDLEKGCSSCPQSESSSGHTDSQHPRFRRMSHSISKSESSIPPSKRRSLLSSPNFPKTPREEQDREEYERVYSSLTSFRFPSPSPSSPTPEKAYRSLRTRSCALPRQRTPPLSGTPLPAVPLSHSAPQFPPSYPAAVSTETLDRLFSQPARPDSLTIPLGLFQANFDAPGENCMTPPPAYAHFPDGTASSSNQYNDQKTGGKQ